MVKKRDSQRKKVYAWERACVKNNLVPRIRNLSLTQAQNLVNLCRARFGMRPNVIVRKMRSDALTSYYKGYRREITIAPFHFDEDVVIHEACHSIALGHDHHAFFVKVKIELMGFICGADKVAMRRLATDMRVKWRHSKVIVPQGNYKSAIASCRRKYRRSFNGDFMSDKHLVKSA